MVINHTWKSQESTATSTNGYFSKKETTAMADLS
jgi:hypothetical protein